MPAPSPIDPAAIEQLREINPDDGGEFVRELVDIFLADTPQRIREIQSSLNAQDASTLTRAAHSIKGSSGNFGAAGLQAAAFAIEKNGREADFVAARANLPTLLAEFDKVQVALTHVVASL